MFKNNYLSFYRYRVNYPLYWLSNFDLDFLLTVFITQTENIVMCFLFIDFFLLLLVDVEVVFELNCKDNSIEIVQHRRDLNPRLPCSPSWLICWNCWNFWLLRLLLIIQNISVLCPIFSKKVAKCREKTGLILVKIADLVPIPNKSNNCFSSLNFFFRLYRSFVFFKHIFLFILYYLSFCSFFLLSFFSFEFLHNTSYYMQLLRDFWKWCITYNYLITFFILFNYFYLILRFFHTQKLLHIIFSMHGYYKIEEGTAFSIRHQRNIPYI